MADQKTPDQAPVAELEYTPSPFEELIIQHKSKIILVLVIVGLAVLGYYILKFIQEGQAEKHGVRLHAAKTMDDYRRVAADLKGSASGGTAQFNVARLMFEDGKYADASREFEAFVKDYPEHPLADLGELMLGECDLALNNKESAKTRFNQFVAKYPRSPYGPDAMLRVADLTAGEKKIEEARTLYQNIARQFPGNPLVREQGVVDQRINALGKPEPTLVEFVPEEPPASPAPGSPDATNPPTGTPGTSSLLDTNAPALSLDNPPQETQNTDLTTPAPDKPTTEPAPTNPPATPAPATPAPATPAPAPAAPAKPGNP